MEKEIRDKLVLLETAVSRLVESVQQNTAAIRELCHLGSEAEGDDKLVAVLERIEKALAAQTGLLEAALAEPGRRGTAPGRKHQG